MADAAPPGRRATTATSCPGCRHSSSGIYVRLSVPPSQLRPGLCSHSFFFLIFPGMSKGSSTRGQCLHAMRRGALPGHPVLAVCWHLPFSPVPFLSGKEWSRPGPSVLLAADEVGSTRGHTRSLPTNSAGKPKQGDIRRVCYRHNASSETTVCIFGPKDEIMLGGVQQSPARALPRGACRSCAQPRWGDLTATSLLHSPPVDRNYLLDPAAAAKTAPPPSLTLLRQQKSPWTHI